MQDQGIEPPYNEAVEPAQQDVEARLLAVLLDEDSEQVWMRQELAREFPDAPAMFELAIDTLACTDVRAARPALTSHQTSVPDDRGNIH